MGAVVPEHVHAVADQGPPPRRAAHGTGERLQVQLKLHTAELVELAPAQLARQDGDEVDVAPPETEATHRRGAHEVEALDLSRQHPVHGIEMAADGALDFSSEHDRSLA